VWVRQPPLQYCLGIRWAVLVNEFGEMGIDGHLIENNEASLTIKQVPAD